MTVNTDVTGCNDCNGKLIDVSLRPARSGQTICIHHRRDYNVFNNSSTLAIYDLVVQDKIIYGMCRQ